MGLKNFVPNELKLKKLAKAEEALSEKSQLVRFISAHSSFYGDKLIDFMETYHLTDLQSATVEQLREYVDTHAQQWDDAEITKQSC